MELLTKLGINWQLLIAQAVNFGLVVGVLSFLVYRPLLNLLDQRRERIRASLEDAKKIETQKQEMEVFRQEQMRKVDQETGMMLERAKQEAEQAKKQILEGAQAEANRILQRGEQKLAEERSRVFAEVQGTVAALIVRLTQKLLSREFSAEDQKRMVAELSQELSSANA